MKIKETIERECCMQHDLKSYLGKFLGQNLMRKHLNFVSIVGKFGNVQEEWMMLDQGQMYMREF